MLYSLLNSSSKTLSKELNEPDHTHVDSQCSGMTVKPSADVSLRRTFANVSIADGGTDAKPVSAPDLA